MWRSKIAKHGDIMESQGNSCDQNRDNPPFRFVSFHCPDRNVENIDLSRACYKCVDKTSPNAYTPCAVGLSSVFIFPTHFPFHLCTQQTGQLWSCSLISCNYLSLSRQENWDKWFDCFDQDLIYLRHGRSLKSLFRIVEQKLEVTRVNHANVFVANTRS